MVAWMSDPNSANTPRAEESSVENFAKECGVETSELQALVTGILTAIAERTHGEPPDPHTVARMLGVAIATGARAGRKAAAEFSDSVQADIDRL
jgi:hypothetical protein